MELLGIHHVTAITARAVGNLSFYTLVLGLRLVKKTVNQDDTSAYHLFYADAAGHPGTDVTFFDWPNTAKNSNGTGSIAQIALRVSNRQALEWWAERLTEFRIPHGEIASESGNQVMHFADPEGLELALVNDEGTPGGTPWERSPVPTEMGIKGLGSVTLMVLDLQPIAAVLTKVLGFQAVREYKVGGDPIRRVVVFATGNGGLGAQVHVEAGPHLGRGVLGHGGVHHVAFRTPDDAEHVAWREKIMQAGLNVTPVIDRFYFHSIYFRVPGGILFEIATDGPGFAADEDPAHLGESLALPPFLEPYRTEIERGLYPLDTPVPTASQAEH